MFRLQLCPLSIVHANALSDAKHTACGAALGHVSEHLITAQGGYASLAPSLVLYLSNPFHCSDRPALISLLICLNPVHQVSRYLASLCGMPTERCIQKLVGANWVDYTKLVLPKIIYIVPPTANRWMNRYHRFPTTR
jgi:hypothetical protein